MDVISASPECIVSNDVFEYELQLLTSNPDKLDENDLAIRFNACTLAV